MKKKINSKFMLISAIAIIVMAICAMVLFYDILKKQIFDDLKANAHVISMMNPEDLPDEINYNLNKDGLRITLINEDGTVIYDSMEDESKMENHRERPEIASALAAGEGRAMRKSTTSAKHTFYYAMRTDDGKVLRIGKDSNSIYSLIIKMVYLTLSVGFCVFVLCTVLAHRLTRRLVAPIEKMADNIVLLEENDVYDEMKPFVATIKQQHVDILKHSQMRQEFTANVSHELKTPLTAIITYVDLLKREDITEEERKSYIATLEQKSQRLKVLIEDLFEVSKAHSGNVKMNFMDMDVVSLLKQVRSEMGEQIESSDLQFRWKFPEEKVMLSLDGQRTYRVFENLINNILKYAMPHSRVYIDIIPLEKEVKILFRNISEMELNYDVESLTERFVRGDAARNSEGSGLGLSIAKDLTTLQGGSLELTIDGDLFKVSITFPIKN